MKTDAERGYFPFLFYEGFLDYLDAHREHVEVLTYSDLDWEDDYNYRENYAEEWSRWKKSLRTGDRDPSKIYIVIQHDVDGRPELTDAALEAEACRKFRSNVMFFNKRVRRKHYQETGEICVDPAYVIQYDRWQELARKGFEFCYHANSFEQSGFDAVRSMEIFKKDVEDLRRYFPIKFFSPHGGARSPEGTSNNSLPIPASLERDIRWVANGHTVRFDRSFSDGGLNSKKRDPNERDLRDFVQTWRPGGRYRVLTHPQYYSEPCRASARLSEASWYRQLLADHKNHIGNLWADVPPLKSH